MNSGPQRLIGWGVLALIVLGIIYWLAQVIYFAPAAALQEEIETAEGNIERFRGYRRTLAGYQEDLQSFADQTLGSREEEVVHRLRTSLTTIASEVGLAEVTASDGQRRAESSPAKIEIRRNNPHRNRVDFVEQTGVVSGTGTLEQAMRLVHRIESAPWHKRIDEVKLDPKDNGATVMVTVRLSTPYLPDYSPGEGLNVEPYDGSTFARYAAFTATNPFRIPPPPPAPQPLPEQPKPTPPKPRPAPPPFPYAEWVVTGLAEGSSGPEVWLRRGKEMRRLATGERIHEVEFVAYVGDQAEFLHGDNRFLVGVGRSLGDRTPVNQ